MVRANYQSHIAEGLDGGSSKSVVNKILGN